MLAILITVAVLFLCLYMRDIAFDYDFSTGPIYGHIIYWLMTLVPIMVIVFWNLILYKNSLRRFKMN